MPRQALNLATLSKFDFGKADAAFRHCLQRAAQDVMDRPGDGSPRKVTLTATITPRIEQDGDVVGCNIAFLAHAQIPKYATAPTAAQLDRQGRVIFTPSEEEEPEPADD